MTKNIFYFIFILFLSSCTIQKAYIVNSPNVNCFIYEKEKNLKVAFNNVSLNAQTNIALNNKFGISASLCGGMEYLSRNNFFSDKSRFLGAEIAGIYYKYLSNTKYFELQAGYGYFDNQMEGDWALDPFSAMGLHGSSFNCESNTNYHKLFLQPSIIFVKKRVILGFALKCNAVYFDQYYFHYDKVTDDGDGEGSDGRREREGSTSFNDKYGFVLEPVINLKLGHVFFIQFVGALSNNIVTGKAYEYLNYHLLNPPTYYNFSNPQLTYFKINFGLEFKLGKDKKPIIHD